MSEDQRVVPVHQHLLTSGQNFGTTIDEPHVGIYGIIVRQQSWLLIKKARGPYKGRLDLPGGTPEPGESRLQTLVREVKEETGVIVVRARPLGEMTLRFDYNTTNGLATFHHHAIYFTVSQYDAKQIHQKNGVYEDAQGCLWSNLDMVERDHLSPVIISATGLMLRQATCDV